MLFSFKILDTIKAIRLFGITGSYFRFTLFVVLVVIVTNHKGQLRNNLPVNPHITIYSVSGERVIYFVSNKVRVIRFAIFPVCTIRVNHKVIRASLLNSFFSFFPVILHFKNIEVRVHLIQCLHRVSTTVPCRAVICACTGIVKTCGY